MRERITFVHGRHDGLDAQNLRLENNTLHIRGLKAAREDRYTFGFQELPQEVLLKSSHWSSQDVDTYLAAMASVEAVPRAPYPMVFKLGLYFTISFRL